MVEEQGRMRGERLLNIGNTKTRGIRQNKEEDSIT